MITEITALYAGLGVVFIVNIILLAIAISINNNLKVIFHQQTDVIDNFSNLNNASRRIEKLCDAINQRTRAHLITPSKTKTTSSKDSDTKAKSNKKTGKSNDKKYPKVRRTPNKQTTISLPASNFASVTIRETTDDQD